MQRVMPAPAGASTARTAAGSICACDSDRWARLLRPDLAHGHEGRVPPAVRPDRRSLPLGLLMHRHRFVAGQPGPRPATRAARRAGRRAHGRLAGMVPFQTRDRHRELNFYNTQMRAWWVIGIALGAGGRAAGAGPGIARARGSVRAKLAAATHRLVGGRLRHGADRCRAPATTSGRPGAATSTRWRDALEDTERTRRAFMADISHELRTPLAVVRAELEAIEDGIRPLDLRPPWRRCRPRSASSAS